MQFVASRATGSNIRHGTALLLAALALVMSSSQISVAFAQSGAPALQEPVEFDPIPPPHTEGPYSTTLASGISLLGSALSIGLLMRVGRDEISGNGAIGMLALTIAPSAGHLYTRDWSAAIIGSSIRGVSGFALLYLTARDTSPDADAMVAMACILGLMAGTAYSLIDAPMSVLRANRSHRRRQVSPTVITGPDGNRGLGMMLGGQF